MVRKHRRDFKGAWHHVMNRGACQRKIFLSERDCLAFLNILGTATNKFEIETHAYTLMSTHYHLFVRSLYRNLSRVMQYIESRYALQFNARYDLNGPLFRDRFKNKIVNDENYQKHLLAYIHLNPVEAIKTVRADEARWTSHRAYIGLEHAPPWLTTSYMLGILGGATRLDRFVEGIRCGQEPAPEGFNPNDWLQEDGKKTTKAADTEFVPIFNLPPSKKSSSRSKEAILKDVYRITGSNLEKIRCSARGRGANPARRFAAWTLSRSTRLSLREIAEFLHMSHRQITCLLNRMRNGNISSELQAWINEWCSAENEM